MTNLNKLTKVDNLSTWWGIYLIHTYSIMIHEQITIRNW